MTTENESIEQVLHEALEGQLIAFQILLLELGQSNAIDMDRYLSLLLDYRSKHVQSDSGTEIVIDRILQMMTGEADMEPYARRLSMQLVVAENPDPAPSQPVTDPDE